jgi:type IV pilus assembly protein PilC
MLMRSVKLLLIALISAAALVAIAIVVTSDESPAPTLIAIAVGFIAVITLLLAWWWSLQRARQQRDAAKVLHYLDQAVRLNLPLPRMVRAIGATGDRSLSDRMDAVAADLEGGAPLARALTRVPQMPSRVLDVIIAAETTGRLPQALDRLMEQRRESAGRHLRWIPFYRVYPFVVGVAFIVVSMMYFVFVVPKFEAMFHDFNTKLPGIVQVFLAIARFCWPGIVLLMLAIFALLIARTIFGWWRGAGFGLVEPLGGRIANCLPIVGQARRYRALADAFDFCADAIDAGLPFEASIADASQLVGNAPVARKLRRWSDATSRGMTIPDAARNAGLPRLVASLLSTALYANGFVEVLRFLARYYRFRFTRAVALIEASAAPLIALSMGFLVLWLAIAMLAPLISLIQTLSSPAAGPHL